MTTAAIADAPPTPHAYYRHLNQHRFTVELELISSLASPSYLTNLHAQGHLHNAAFLRYLAHVLRTWSTPRYVRFVRFPQALVYGRALVQSPAFRQAVGTDGWENEATREMIAAWLGGHGDVAAHSTAANPVASHTDVEVQVTDANGNKTNGGTKPQQVKEEDEQ